MYKYNHKVEKKSNTKEGYIKSHTKEKKHIKAYVPNQLKLEIVKIADYVWNERLRRLMRDKITTKG